MDTPTMRGSLLVIDDDAVMREVLSAVLGMEGYAVHLVESGDEGLAFLAKTKVDVMLVDLHMPGLQGAELADRLKGVRAAGMPLIGMSGSRPSEDEMRLYGAFLHKPFAMEEFAQAVAIASHAPGAKDEPQQDAAATGMGVLDEDIYERMKGILPVGQLQELYRITISDVTRRLGLMREAVGRGDFEACRGEAHAIKGGCGMVGATELSALAAKAEAGSAAESPPFADFDAACARLQVMLDARL